MDPRHAVGMQQAQRMRRMAVAPNDVDDWLEAKAKAEQLGILAHFQPELDHNGVPQDERRVAMVLALPSLTEFCANQLTQPGGRIMEDCAYLLTDETFNLVKAKVTSTAIANTPALVML